MPRFRVFLAAFCLIICQSLFAESQSILYLKDGSRLVGLVEAWTGQYYLVRSPAGHLSRIESRRIQSVENKAFPRLCNVALSSDRTIEVEVMEITEKGILIKVPQEDKARKSLFQSLEKEEMQTSTLELNYDEFDSLNLFGEKKESEKPNPAM
ncbi:MAG: hypothetical protein RH862_04515 [Leptospiraceae bacterium]